MKYGIDFNTMKLVKIEPTHHYVWFYQHAGEEKQEIIKEGRFWYYNAPENLGEGLNGEVGCDTLQGAKGDLLLYEGTKIWRELVK